jgi:hypothetical protein
MTRAIALNPINAMEKLSGRRMTIKTLIMQNSGVISYHDERIKKQAPADIFPPTKVLLSSFFWPYACHDSCSNAVFR